MSTIHSFVIIKLGRELEVHWSISCVFSRSIIQIFTAVIVAGFGINPFTSFYGLPTTVADALKDGWKLDTSAGGCMYESFCSCLLMCV